MINQFPKIANFYWGNSTISFVRVLTLYTFSKLNPDWTIKLYVPLVKDSVFTHTSSEQRRSTPFVDCYHLIKQIPNVQIIVIDFTQLNIPETLSDIYKSDIIRWKILSEEGGLWADMDIIFHKPMTALKFINNHNTPYVICKYPIKHTAYPIGFLLSKPNCSFYKELYQDALSKLSNDVENYQKYGTHIFTEKVNKQKVYTELSHESVYPVIPSKLLIEQMYETKSFNFKNNIGLHWFGGHPKGDLVESQMSPTTIDGFGLISLMVREFERTTNLKINSLQ